METIIKGMYLSIIRYKGQIFSDNIIHYPSGAVQLGESPIDLFAIKYNNNKVKYRV